MTDRKLLARFAFSGSDEAFAKLVDRHAGMVYSTCLRMLGTQGAAEEAAGAVFMVLARKAGRLASQGALAGWLYTTAYKVSRRAQRAAERRKRRERVHQVFEEKVLTETSQFAAVE